MLIQERGELVDRHFTLSAVCNDYWPWSVLRVVKKVFFSSSMMPLCHNGHNSPYNTIFGSNGDAQCIQTNQPLDISFTICVDLI